jgi:death on curing protein
VNEPQWIAYDVVLAIHEAQLAEHGGLSGIRDEGLLRSALARPKNFYTYSEAVTLNKLAAIYAVRIAKNLAFLDGNKRTGWVVCAAFLELNGMTVISGEDDVVRMMLGAADCKISEIRFAHWLQRDHPYLFE